MSHNLCLYIDVSGSPYGNINIGLSSISTHKLTVFLKTLKRKYPKFLRTNHKGSNFKPSHIQSLVNFFNGQGIRMIRGEFRRKDWGKVKEYLNNKQYLKEMTYAALYFKTLTRYSFEGEIYPLCVCHESYLDIQKVKQYLKKLAKAHRVDYQISDTYASQCEMLKVSDIVAASNKAQNNFNGLEYFELCNINFEDILPYLKKLKK